MRKMLELGRQDRYKFNNKENGKFLKYHKNKKCQKALMDTLRNQNKNKNKN